MSLRPRFEHLHPPHVNRFLSKLLSEHMVIWIHAGKSKYVASEPRSSNPLAADHQPHCRSRMTLTESQTCEAETAKEYKGEFRGFHHVEFWVGNAKQAATYFIARF